MTKKTLKELIEEMKLKPAEVLNLMKKGFKLGEETTPESIKEAIGKISDLLTTPVPSDLEDILADADDVHLIFVRDSVKNVVYATIAYRGKVWMTQNDGKLCEDYLSDDLDDVFDELVQAGIPQRATDKKREGIKGKGRPHGSKDKEPRMRNPTFIYDPHLIAYLKKNARLIVDEMCRAGGKGNGKRHIRNPSDLERILPSQYLNRSGRMGLEVYAQNRVNFVRDNASRLRARRDAFLGQLLDNVEIAELIERFFNEKFTKDEAVDMPRLETYVTSHRSAKDVYTWFTTNRVESTGPDAVIGALRERLLHIYGKDRRADLPKNERDKLETITQRTLAWVSVANACENVKDDAYVQEQVIPYFQNIKTQATTAERRRYQLSDATYTGLARLATKVLDLEDTFTFNQFKFCLGGLWCLGYLLTDNGTAGDDPFVDFIDGNLRERSLQATTSQFQKPLSHLVKRIAVYDPILKKAFSRLESIGRTKNLVLETQRDCSALALALYREIHPTNPKNASETPFTRLIGEGNDQMVLEAPDDHESHLARVLKLYVSANKDYFLRRGKYADRR